MEFRCRARERQAQGDQDRKSTRLNSSHVSISYAVFCLKKKSHTLEDLFEVHTVRTGDTFFVPPGTAHSIGPNLIVCELQEYSDLTYRVYDYGRLGASGT